VYMYSIVAGSTGGPRTGAPSQPCARAREPTCAFTALTDRPGAGPGARVTSQTACCSVGLPGRGRGRSRPVSLSLPSVG
jgi:hypothetical protein